MKKYGIVKTTDGNGFSKFWVEEQRKKFWVFGPLIWRNTLSDGLYGSEYFFTYKDTKRCLDYITIPSKVEVLDEVSIRHQ